MGRRILWGVGLIAVLWAASISLASWTGERGSSGDPRFWGKYPIFQTVCLRLWLVTFKKYCSLNFIGDILSFVWILLLL